MLSIPFAASPSAGADAGAAAFFDDPGNTVSALLSAFRTNEHVVTFGLPAAGAAGVSLAGAASVLLLASAPLSPSVFSAGFLAGRFFLGAGAAFGSASACSPSSASPFWRRHVFLNHVR